MARAKRTQRAEARRRYRAGNASADELDMLDSTEPAPAGKAAASSSTAKATGTPPRGGILDGFRASFRPLHVREDLAAFPWIALHTRALWVPVLMTLAATVVVIANGAGTITTFILGYILSIPAINSFSAGLLAPRASWLLGAVVGLVTAACFSVLIIAFPATLTDVVPTATQTQQAVFTAFATTPIVGAFFAAAAAWYRRFLYLSNPNRARREAQRASQKRTTADGRSRTSGTSQKAPVKR